MSDADINRLYLALPCLPGCQCIRVLQVLPPLGKDSKESPNECSLNVVDLRDEPGYMALSYVWRVIEPPPDTILCDGVRVLVTLNS